MRTLKLRTADVHWREIDGELIALEARSSMYLAANGPGALLWRALAAGATRDALADELVARYGIDRDRALGDTDRFVAELADRDLLEP